MTKNALETRPCSHRCDLLCPVEHLVRKVPALQELRDLRLYFRCLWRGTMT
jgi:hypothetical protein